MPLCVKWFAVVSRRAWSCLPGRPDPAAAGHQRLLRSSSAPATTIPRHLRRRHQQAPDRMRRRPPPPARKKPRRSRWRGWRPDRRVPGPPARRPGHRAGRPAHPGTRPAGPPGSPRPSAARRHPRAVKRLANSYGLLTALRREHRAADLTAQPGTVTGPGTGSEDEITYYPDRASMVLVAFPALGPALFLHHSAAADLTPAARTPGVWGQVLGSGGR